MGSVAVNIVSDKRITAHMLSREITSVKRLRMNFINGEFIPSG
jgi:hypothetical protein